MKAAQLQLQCSSHISAPLPAIQLPEKEASSPASALEADTQTISPGLVGAFCLYFWLFFCPLWSEKDKKRGLGQIRTVLGGGSRTCARALGEGEWLRLHSSTPQGEPATEKRLLSLDPCLARAVPRPEAGSPNSCTCSATRPRVLMHFKDQNSCR